MSTTVCGDSWPQFRGPNGDGVVEAATLPLAWSAEENVRWKVPNPGEGWSCPVVWNDKVFLTAAVMQRPPATGSTPPPRPEPYRGGGGSRRSDLSTAVYTWEVYCFDAQTGDVLWKRVARTGNPVIPRHSSNSYATETPVTDGERIYVYFGMHGCYCYDFDGNLVWQKDLGTYEMRAGWGTSSSPVLFEDKLYLQVDNEQQSFLVALDCRSGDEIWRVSRAEPSQYSSPVVWRHSRRAELVAGGQVCRSYDPQSGQLLWELEMGKGRSSATPLPHGDRLFVGTEFRNRGGPDDGGGFLFAVRAGADGDITPEPEATASAGVVWRIERSGIQMASPAICQGHLYLLERRSGMLHCVNALTGETAYRQRIPGARAFWASPWTCADKVFCLDDNGTTHVLASGPKFKVLATNALGEQCWSTPAAANDALFLRTADHLYCIAAAEPL